MHTQAVCWGVNLISLGYSTAVDRSQLWMQAIDPSLEEGDGWPLGMRDLSRLWSITVTVEFCRQPGVDTLLENLATCTYLDDLCIQAWNPETLQLDLAYIFDTSCLQVRYRT